MRNKRVNFDKGDYEVEALVFRVFLKHIKANNLYIPFRWSVNRDKGDIIHAISSTLCRNKYRHSSDMMARIGAAFASAHSCDDIITGLRYTGKRVKKENNEQFQMSLMNMVNVLLHNCVEHAVTEDMQILEKIGSAVFEEVGKTLFGDSFKDITKEAIDPMQRDFMDKMHEMGMDMPSLREESRERLMRFLRDRFRNERRRNQEQESEMPRGFAALDSRPPMPWDFEEDIDDWSL